MVKKSFVTFFLLVVLFCVYQFYLKADDQSHQVVATGNSLLPARSSQEILEIEIERPEKPVLHLKRSGAAWEILEPYRSNADQIIAGGMAVALSKARTIEPFTINSAESQNYGLVDAKATRLKILVKDEPSRATRSGFIGHSEGRRPEESDEILRFAQDDSRFSSHPEARSAEGSASQMLRYAQHDRTYETTSILIGEKHPFRDVYYASRQQQPEEVFFLDGQLVRALNKSEYSLREKRIFRFQDRKSTRLTLSLFGTFIRLFRGLDNQWHLQDRPEAEVYEKAVENLWSELRNLYVKEFLFEEDAKAPEFGIIDSDDYVSILWEDGNMEILTVGNPIDQKNAYYTQKGPEDSPLILIAKTNLHALVSRPEDFVDRSISKIEADHVELIEIIQKGRTGAFKKIAGNIWMSSAGGELSKEIQNAVSLIVKEISELRYDRIFQSSEDAGIKEEVGNPTSLRFLKESKELIVALDFLREGERCFIINPSHPEVFEISNADSRVLDTLLNSLGRS